jgi:hypothetical protein
MLFGEFMAKSNTGLIAIGIIVVILIVGVGIYAATRGKTNNQYTTTVQNSSSINSGSTIGYSTTATQSQASSNPVVVTDPPQVPKGTSALVVSYSSVAVQSGSNSGWTSASGSGSVNLVDTVNSSEVVGYANLTAGTTVKAVRMYATSAYIVVNGTTYNVSVPSQITANVTGNATASSSGAIVFDMASTTSAFYNQNTTTFAMSPSTKAVVLANAGVSQSASIGSMVDLNSDVHAMLMEATPQISISGASVATVGNSTTINVTVKNNANSSVTVSNLVLYGNQNVSTSSSAGVNGSILGSINSGLGGSINISTGVMAAIDVGLNIKSFNSATFVATSSGQLSVPSSQAQFSGASGVTIAPGSSATLTFTGVQSYDSGLYIAKPMSGTQYMVTVVGNSGATASSYVTAK